MALDYSILNDFIKDNDCVLIGVSGGADSMCLLDLAIKYKKICQYKLIAVHINHNLRDKEAERDENFVREYCKNNNVNLICESIKTIEYKEKNSKTIEQAARELRYSVFDMLLEREGANKILVAHHQDDQAETVLMHISRGSSLRGARGMSKNSNKIARPLLSFSREEIVYYNHVNKIDFINDTSNEDTKYVRNHIRHKVLPELEKVYPNVKKSLGLFAERCKRDEEFIESLLPLEQLKYKKDYCEISVEVSKINYVLASRLIKKAFENLGFFADIEERHINQIIALCNGQNGKKLCLPNGLVAYKEYENIVISPNNNESKTLIYPFTLGEFNFAGVGKISITKLNSNEKMVFTKGCLFIDGDKIPKDAKWRTKELGDVFKKFGSGTKKLSDYLIDVKMPKRLRDLVPVLAKDNIVYVVAGQEISELVKVTETSKNIIKICYDKE